MKYKIGIFDSGLGGLLTLNAIRSALPRYEYAYLGDTKRMPYGSKRQTEIRKFTIEGIEFLFQQNCKLVIIACNTASAKSLRYIQQSWLPKNYPDRKVLGVIIPTVESIASNKKIKSVGILATQSTVNSKAYKTELWKLNPTLKVFQISAPLLVPDIENKNLTRATENLKVYVKKFVAQQTDAILLGCTHYPILKKQLRAIIPGTEIVSQDEIIPNALKKYLQKHSEIRRQLSQAKSIALYTTKLTAHSQSLALRWFGRAKLQQVTIKNKKESI